MAGVSPTLTDAQRATIPADHHILRRLESAGGYDTVTPRTIAKGLDDQDARYPGTSQDSQVRRSRQPWMHYETYVPAADGYVNWTLAGPRRPELHMRNVTMREMVGNTQGRFPVVNTPTTGMHTMGPAGVARTAQRYVVLPQQTGARINRLSPARYNGQTYSALTQVNGG